MEIEINQDIRNFKTKDIGMFSFEEFLYVLVAGALGIGMFYLMYQTFPTWELSVQLFPCVIVMAVPLLFGFGKFFGLSTKDFLQTVLIENYFSPTLLKWENDYEEKEI